MSSIPKYRLCGAEGAQKEEEVYPPLRAREDPSVRK